MINAQRTGAYISALRRQKDWTQQELAERLHITHQAVSQWEKGAAFPDIGQLPPLARLLGVSVDDLLNGEPLGWTKHARVTAGAIVEGLAKGQPDEVARLVKDEPEGLDRMLDAAPLARPSQLNEIVSDLGDDFKLTPEQAGRLAPFVSQEVLESLLERSAFEMIDTELMVELAPFVAQPTIDRLAQRATRETMTLDVAKHLAPFVSQATLEALLTQLEAAGHTPAPDDLEELAPFLGQAALGALLQRVPAGALSLEHLVAIAPFIRREELDAFVAEQDPAKLGSYLEELAPFLSQDGLKRIIVQSRRTLSFDQLLDLAPFLDRATLDEMLRKGTRA